MFVVEISSRGAEIALRLMVPGESLVVALLCGIEVSSEELTFLFLLTTVKALAIDIFAECEGKIQSIPGNEDIGELLHVSVKEVRDV